MSERDAGAVASPIERVRTLFEGTESQAAKAFEQAVSTRSVGTLLARAGENAAALARIGSGLADLALRNLRLAGRADIVALARQLRRTEDKLERVLQELEQLRDELEARDRRPARASARRNGDGGDGRRRAPAAP
ncbi:MAG: hypothetical protein ACLP50_32040 [Solirubrobacteraceae bacterium]